MSQEEASVRAVLADRESSVRRALAALLEHLDIEAAGEVSSLDGLEAEVLASKPDLVLAEWDLLGDDKPASLTTLRSCHPGLRIVVFGLRPETRALALAAGADAYVCKVDDPGPVINAVKSSQAQGRENQRGSDVAPK
jgi:DNA-binding NarL/FixJ family response regulator